MKTLRIFMAIGAAVVAAGCAKEINGNVDRPHTRITVGIEDQTRTVFSDIQDGKRSILWTNGDKLNINGVTSAPLELEEPAASASFDFEGVLDQPYNTLYPAEIYNDASTVTLPKTVVSQVLPLAGQGLSVKALTAVVRINITKGSHEGTLKKIVFTSKGGVQLCGPFTIDYAAATITGTDASEANQSVELALNDVLGEETLSYYIPVPAGTYGFKVRVLDSKGHYMEKETTFDKELKQGEIFGMTPFAFEPTGTQVDIVVSSAAAFVQFAKDYNEGNIEQDVVFQLDDDIEFDETSSAEFLETGGIGTSSVKFNGTFYGNGKTIKGWKNYSLDATGKAIDSSVPLFSYTGSAGTIENLTIDASCDVRVGKGIFGTVVGYHMGELNNVTVKSKLIYQEVAGTARVGGIVGRVYGGSVTGCSNEGGLNMPTGYGSTTKELRVGGIAGTVEEGGVVKDCYLKNGMDFGTREAGTGPQNPNGEVMAGGIVGDLMKGTLENCHCNYDAADASSGAVLDLRGKSGLIYAGMIAGKVGQDGELNACTSAAEVSIYVRMTANATFSNDNYTSEPTIACVGGIVGYNEGSIVSSPNNGSSVTCNHGAAYQYSGGIAGYNGGTISGSNNSGNVKGPVQYVTVKKYYSGGIVGWTTSRLENLSNSGSIYWVPSATDNAVYETSGIGGCVGKSDASLTGLTNTGDVTYGEKSWTVVSKFNNLNAGGICAEATTPSTTISGCSNSGYIQVTAPGTLDATAPCAHVAGIVANVCAGTTVSGCINAGKLYNGISNNTITETASEKTGGIVAFAKGSSDARVTITNCKNLNTAGATYNGARGYLGGIAAWADNTDVTGCESTMSQSGFLGWFSAGIAARMVATTVSGCTARSGIVGRYVARGAAGGITAVMDGTSKVLDSEYFGAIAVGDNQTTNAAKLGGIAGTSVSGAEISGCRFGGTIKACKNDTVHPMTASSICSDTNFTVNAPNTLITE